MRSRILDGLAALPDRSPPGSPIGRSPTNLLLSLQTVRTYLRRMFASWASTTDRTHLAVLAHQAGLLHDGR
jgi:hypothetical protein